MDGGVGTRPERPKGAKDQVKQAPDVQVFNQCKLFICFYSVIVITWFTESKVWLTYTVV